MLKQSRKQHGDAAKTGILARAIVDATRARKTASILDGTQAGLTEAEVKRLWDDAMIAARRIEPRLPQMVAA